MSNQIVLNNLFGKILAYKKKLDFHENLEKN